MVLALTVASLATIGQWPWPRTTVARLLETLRDQGAAAVAFDGAARAGQGHWMIENSHTGSFSNRRATTRLSPAQ